MRLVFLRWWIIFCLSIFGGIGLYFLDFYSYLWDMDLSKLSFIIISIFVVVSLRLGQLHYKLTKGVFPRYSLKPLKEFSDIMLGLGLVGTLFGFSWVLINSFVGIDISDTDQIKSAMGQIGSGMGTAVYTSLVGMTSSIITRIQIINLESGYDRKDAGDE